MKQFLINAGKVYSYGDLLKDIQEQNYYYPVYKTDDVYLYFLNLVKALIHKKKLVLLDSDISSLEVDAVNDSQINQVINLPHIDVFSFTDIVDFLKKSTSEITIFTSGTTGQPKKVVHTLSSLTRTVRMGDKYKDNIWGFAYNPTHMAGLQVFFQAIENSNTLVNIFNGGRKEIYRVIEEYKISHLSATPTFYRLLLPFEKDYKSVVRVTLGGEKSDENLYASIHKIFPEAKINNVYASTEAGTLFAAKGDCFQIPETIRDKFLIENDELLIHKSLLGLSESFNFEGDFYRSGDLIEWVDNAKGLFRFTSRKNELINVGGYKVNPSEVESCLLSIDGIQQVLVYGKSNSVLGNILCADIKLEANSCLTELEIKKTLRLYLQDFKVPRRIKFVNELILTRTGKLKRK